MTGWAPKRVVRLRDVLSSSSLLGLRVGDEVAAIEERLGPSEGGPAVLNRKGLILVWQYGNVTVLSDSERVLSIEVSYEGPRTTMVDGGDLLSWRMFEWNQVANAPGVSTSRISDITHLSLAGTRMSLGPAGELHLVTLTSS